MGALLASCCCVPELPRKAASANHRQKSRSSDDGGVFRRRTRDYELDIPFPKREGRYGPNSVKDGESRRSERAGATLSSFNRDAVPRKASLKTIGT